jgi:hypothetical protein
MFAIAVYFVWPSSKPRKYDATVYEDYIKIMELEKANDTERKTGTDMSDREFTDSEITEILEWVLNERDAQSLGPNYDLEQKFRNNVAAVRKTESGDFIRDLKARADSLSVSRPKN